MMILTGDNGPARDSIAAIISQVEQDGAVFDPDLRVDLNGSNVAMRSARPFDNLRNMIRMPVASMPALSDFVLTLTGNDLKATPRSDEVSATHVRLMDLMLEAYNALDKVTQWKAESPWFLLADAPDILDHLTTGRPGGRLGKLRNLASTPDKHGQLLIDTFIGSRKFNLNEKAAKTIGRDTGTTVLMPLIDYFNHDMRAEGFRIDTKRTPTTMNILSGPAPETQELFVRYNVFDTLDTWLYYGFIDSQVGYLASVPCVLEAGGRKIHVIASGGGKVPKLAPEIKDLRTFMPSVQKRQDGAYQVTKMIIPGPRAPRALRRVLRICLNSIGIPAAAAPAMVLALEEQLMDHNRAWWTRLAELGAGVPTGHALHSLYGTALAHLDRYENLQRAST